MCLNPGVMRMQKIGDYADVEPCQPTGFSEDLAGCGLCAVPSLPLSANGYQTGWCSINHQPHEPFICSEVSFRVAVIASATNGTRRQLFTVFAAILSTLLAYGMLFHLVIASFAAGYAASARNLLDEH
jgi:hypothetical protein